MRSFIFFHSHSTTDNSPPNCGSKSTQHIHNHRVYLSTSVKKQVLFWTDESIWMCYVAISSCVYHWQQKKTNQLQKSIYFPPPCAIHENVPCLLLKPCRSTPPVNEMYKHDNIYMATFRCQVLYDAIDDVWHCIWFCYRCEDESIGGWVGFVSFFCPTFVWCGRICGTACCVGKIKEKRKQRRSVVCTTMGDRVGGGGEGAFSDNYSVIFSPSKTTWWWQ